MPPVDNLADVPLENDGSYEHAVATMPDLLADDPKDFDLATGRPIVARADDGKFKAKDEPKEPALKAEPEVKDKGEAKDKTKAEEPETEDEGDFVELAGEKEGDAPVRHKLDDIVQGWQRSKELETELAEAKKVQQAQPLHSDVEQQIVALQAERADAVKAAKTYLQMMQPIPPNEDLLNENSQNYNPAEFNRQLQNYRRQVAFKQEVGQRIENAEKQTKTEQEALRASKITRESAALRKIWPEVLDDPNARASAKKALFDHYQIDDAMLDSDLTLDHRIYALAKDALAYRALQSKQAEAVKAVKAKPRLIQGHARSAPSNPKIQKQTEAYSRLTQSGSVEDAADALENLL